MRLTASGSRSVLVIGAGVAGLTAARILAEAGCKVTVIEASEQVGGRIRTVHAGGCAIELGAEFVHGRPPELLEAIRELGLNRTHRSGTTVHFSNGTLSVGDGDDNPDGVEDESNGSNGSNESNAANESDENNDTSDPSAVLEQMRRWSEAHPKQDLSFADWLDKGDWPPEARASALGYVEGFNAADAREASVRALALQQAAEDSIGGNAVSHIDGGYTLLPKGVAERARRAGATFRMRAQVRGIQWSAGSVKAVLVGGEHVTAEAAVIALPLGVLQSGHVAFQPEPGTVLQQAARMRMGEVCRLTLRFSERWWAALDHTEAEALGRMSFLIGADREREPAAPYFGVFWTAHPLLDPVITAWSGGPSAQMFAPLDDHAIAHLACAQLAEMFGLAEEAVLDRLASHHRHDWSLDPLFLGSYSWVPVGAADASARMSEPVENTLFFAGEHTDTTGHWGTVHGAMRSGLRAARQVLAAT